MNGKLTCTINEDSYFVTKILVWTGYLYYFAIPASVIGISSLILILQVIKAKIKRYALLTDNKNEQNKTGSTIAMLVAVCLVYIALRISWGRSFHPGLVSRRGRCVDENDLVS